MKKVKQIKYCAPHKLKLLYQYEVDYCLNWCPNWDRECDGEKCKELKEYLKGVREGELQPFEKI